MSKRTRTNRLGEITAERYQEFRERIALYISDNRAYIVGQNLALALHKEKDVHRTAKVGNRTSDYDGLADFLRRIVIFSPARANDVLLDMEIKDYSITQAVYATKAHFLSQNIKPEGESLYP